MKTSQLPPLSPVGQLLYDIMGIIESGTQSVADQRRDAVERLGKAPELACTFDEATLTVRIAPLHPNRTS